MRDFQENNEALKIDGITMNEINTRSANFRINVKSSSGELNTQKSKP